MTRAKGFTLIELMVAVGLFAIVMLLASGAYLVMISLNRQAQNIATGIDNLSFALETMTRNVRTGSHYSCGALGGDCTSGGTSFSFRNPNGVTVTYSLSGTSLLQRVGTTQSMLTDSSVTITSLTFYAYGTKTVSQADYEQSRVSIIVSGTVSSGAGKAPQSFTVETGATMRGSDL
jgi:prepilin-type N-terminal cleavage/methylation domain-containing protein